MTTTSPVIWSNYITLAMITQWLARHAGDHHDIAWCSQDLANPAIMIPRETHGSNKEFLYGYFVNMPHDLEQAFYLQYGAVINVISVLYCQFRAHDLPHELTIKGNCKILASSCAAITCKLHVAGRLTLSCPPGKIPDHVTSTWRIMHEA